ncbi:MAG: iron ABC transporter substrate-binding protein [Dehalococcoidia bacterium]
MKSLRVLAAAAALLVAGWFAASCGGDSETLTVYSGRTQSLVQPVLDAFAAETGIDVRVRYGETAEMAATILEEGGNSPADVFFAQDAGALGALAREGRLAVLPQEQLDRVAAHFRSREGVWVGVSGRARVVAYNTENVDPEELPDSILDFTDPAWRGRIGWAPTNGSFQSFVTALRVIEGEDVARAWLEGIKANDPVDYANNTAALEAVANGEVDVAFINHYYLLQFLAERGESFGARNYYIKGQDSGALVNAAGVAVLRTAKHADEAEQLVEFLLSEEAQQYFAETTYEYPLSAGVPADPRLVPLSELATPDIDLGDLADLEGTLDLLRATEVLP